MAVDQDFCCGGIQAAVNGRIIARKTIDTTHCTFHPGPSDLFERGVRSILERQAAEDSFRQKLWSILRTVSSEI